MISSIDSASSRPFMKAHSLNLSYPKLPAHPYEGQLSQCG